MRTHPAKKKGRKSRKRKLPKSPPRDPVVAKFTLQAGTTVEIRNRGDRRWRPYTMRRTVEMRTTKRVRDALYMEYLGFEVRFTAESLVCDKRFKRY